jgi:small subunit ribosomal protein S3
LRITEHLASDPSIKRAGFAKVDILKTPLGHRVVIHAIRLGMIIGKAGRNIKRITEELESLYGLENPQLEVKELENPDLVARVQADKLLSQIERGFHFRRAAHSLIRRIMGNGARGVEILISGKLSSQRARSEAFREGFVAKAGLPAQRFVDEAVAHSILKQGIIGIKVKIMNPEADLPDEPIFFENPFGDEDTTLAPFAPIAGKPELGETQEKQQEETVVGELENLPSENEETPVVSETSNQEESSQDTASTNLEEVTFTEDESGETESDVKEEVKTDQEEPEKPKKGKKTKKTKKSEESEESEESETSKKSKKTKKTKKIEELESKESEESEESKELEKTKKSKKSKKSKDTED